MKYLNVKLGWQSSDTPSYGSIKNWVEKSGYSVYERADLQSREESYAQIVDESMMIGSEKLLLSLGVKAGKLPGSPLSFQDVNILDISVSRSWNSESIAAVFNKTEAKMGRPPSYVVSDNATTICKAIRDRSYVHIPDIGHTLAMFVERHYKRDALFLGFTKAISDVKFREVMRPCSYLLPPKQRTIARFMNLSDSLHWAGKMLACFHKLSGEEQRVFGFLHSHLPIIRELGAVFQQIDKINEWVKKQGMSQQTITRCRQALLGMSQWPSHRVTAVTRECLEYFSEQESKLKEKNTVWHASSDIIESLFSKYKARKSPNALNGVTRYVMLLPLLTKIDKENGTATLDFKAALEQVFLKDLTRWGKDNLTGNLYVKRKNVLTI